MIPLGSFSESVVHQACDLSHRLQPIVLPTTGSQYSAWLKARAPEFDNQDWLSTCLLLTQWVSYSFVRQELGCDNGCLNVILYLKPFEQAWHVAGLRQTEATAPFPPRTLTCAPPPLYTSAKSLRHNMLHPPYICPSPWLMTSSCLSLASSQHSNTWLHGSNEDVPFTPAVPRDKPPAPVPLPAVHPPFPWCIIILQSLPTCPPWGPAL